MQEVCNAHKTTHTIRILNGKSPMMDNRTKRLDRRSARKKMRKRDHVWFSEEDPRFGCFLTTIDQVRKSLGQSLPLYHFTLALNSHRDEYQIYRYPYLILTVLLSKLLRLILEGTSSKWNANMNKQWSYCVHSFVGHIFCYNGVHSASTFFVLCLRQVFFGSMDCNCPD